MMSETMAVRSNLQVLIASTNLDRAKRGERPLKQKEIAQGAGVSESVISELLAGKSQQIHFNTINGLCGFFGVAPGDLFTYAPDDIGR